MEQDIQSRFIEVFNRDKARYVKSWLVKWDYQVKRKQKNADYGNDQLADFDRFNGPSDLLKWMNWFAKDFPDYLPKGHLKGFIEQSEELDKRVISKLGLEYDFTNYDKRVGLHNAHDFIFPTLYPVPERNRIRNVLDFGAGYGRQANLWTRDKNNIYLGLDAIPKSYCLQNLYYSNLGVPLYDYVRDPDSFTISNDKKGIYHLPTWRYDLLPDNFFDMVMAVQVLRELNSTLVKRMIDEFYRILKPGGMLYIRDHGDIWKPAGKVDIDSYLESHGFVLEFKPHIILDEDLHGIPRIWRKIDKRVADSQTRGFKGKIRDMVSDLDALSGGALRRTFGKSHKPQ